MAENQNLLQMSHGKDGLGKIEIAPEVIEVIAGIAASEVEGVSQMRGNFATGVVERLGKKNHGKGVKVELAEEGIIVDVYCIMKFGVAIPTVAQKIQDNIRQALLNMTALEADEVNVHIVGVQFENQKFEAEIDEEM
ncbi:MULTISPECIES: Asp23/Gls24 family envelope stress response protein [Rossellomorea]|uniref:Asp23/Gls24 family envelope stress response protein n=2 Tax=Rossellomorea vietnamensis TaxID=218284 RepID=A0ACD4C7F3_9BACI|nr:MULTISPECIES: Asp23/Gls24 family envelope stress response protein [Rossellomorea]MCA0147661.1 Asp23/Gls24 family envelope stress response protein [Rossellomorea vietnamensis]MCC5800253.1 Asp23/Gls24 family envelope stress response protein [Rossellomorea vietnamensis]QHE62128.1 Asp23/Gls24 family envelope stress response protein [Rossellomorea vietnamensis]UTE76288.1 Asp23/Gls24 family envelope stress response protein [Rossellomorea sp. KS-H15a]UXH44503.1 Asp23/Gls24 family envelope stress r